MLRTSFYQAKYGINQDFRVTLKQKRTEGCTQRLFDSRHGSIFQEN